MNCPNCEKPLADGAAECLNCGVIPAKWEAVKSRPPRIEAKDVRLSTKGSLVIALTLTLAGAVAAAAWHYRNALPFGSPVHISANEVTASTFHDFFHFRFVKTESFSDSFFIFGATPAEGAAPYETQIDVLPSALARDIYHRYPDFYECASPGSKEALGNLIGFRIFAANGKTSAVLKDVGERLHVMQGTDRIAVRLTGRKLKLTSVMVALPPGNTGSMRYPDGTTVMLHDGDNAAAFIQSTQWHQEYKAEYVLVESAEIIPGKEMLEAP